MTPMALTDQQRNAHPPCGTAPRPCVRLGESAWAGPRAFWAVLLVAAVALLGGCALPPLQGRSVTNAMPPDPTTALGREIAPMVRANLGKTGAVALQGGLEAFATRVHLADMAEKSLDLQYYIWHADLTGVLLMQAVVRAADRGVRVRLLLDDNNTVGLDSALAGLAAHPNIELRLYNPFVQRSARWLGYLTNPWRLNRRMHDKSFTVDGWVSVVGGRNIGDEYFNAGHDANFVDLDVMVIGTVVPEIANDFDRYWNSASACPAKLVLTAEPAGPLPPMDPVEAADYLDALHKDTVVRELQARSLKPEWVDAYLVSDDPRKTTDEAGSENIVLHRLERAFGDPLHNLYVVSPYFVPAREGASAFTRIAGSGVDTRVLTNSFNATDVAVVHAGYARYRKELLQGGVRLFELKPDPVDPRDPEDDEVPDAAAQAGQGRAGLVGSGGSIGGSGAGGAAQSGAERPRRRWTPTVSRASLHAKTSEVDEKRVFVGSFNFDPRSVAINTEMGVVLDSPVLATRLVKVFHRAQNFSYEVKLNEQGDLIWVEPPADGQGEPRIYTTEPGTSWWQRLMLKAIGWLPIEKLL